MSTCLAAAVGTIAIGVMIYGSLDTRQNRGNAPSVLDRLNVASLRAPMPSFRTRAEGLPWAVPKMDRLQPAVGAPVIQQLIREQIRVRRNGRPYTQVRPYMRIVTKLQPVPISNTDVIPAFNPIALYAPKRKGRKSGGEQEAKDFKFKVIDLLGGAMPVNDGQNLSDHQVTEIVARFVSDAALVAGLSREDGAAAVDGVPLAPGRVSHRGIANAPNTTVAYRTPPKKAEEATEDLERQERRIHTLRKGDRLSRLLRKFGGDKIQVRSMLEAMRTIIHDKQLEPGLQLHVTLVPSLTSDRKEPARFSIYSEAGEHKVSVMRNAAGEFIASARPFASAIARAALAAADKAEASSIYASMYYAALLQGIAPETILQKQRIHAYDTDFRRRIRNGDYAEYFFELDRTLSDEGTFGDLLYTALATGGEFHRFWRFRAPDGTIDYYDANGRTSRKFLLRRPVRGQSVRLSSGFGMRFHPLLRTMRPHRGIDWAAPRGTPILAAGNGVVEEARHRGEYGKYVRIRHANSYRTAYAHMRRFARGIKQGVRVRQGQVIGFIGSTGLSAGPHLHYEVLVNSKRVNPLSIQVPRERQLTGRALADFKRERARIDELMRRQPVMMSQSVKSQAAWRPVIKPNAYANFRSTQSQPRNGR